MDRSWRVVRFPDRVRPAVLAGTGESEAVAGRGGRRFAAGARDRVNVALGFGKLNHLKMKTLGREECRHVLGQASPGAIHRTRNRQIQIEEELIRETVDGWRLPKRQSQPYGVFEPYAVSWHRFFQQQIDETGPACM